MILNFSLIFMQDSGTNISRNTDSKSAAADLSGRRAFDHNFTTMIFNDFMNNRKAETGTLLSHRKKGFKDLFQFIFGNTGAVIFYPEMKPGIRNIQLSTDIHMTTRRYCLQRIEQKV